MSLVSECPSCGQKLKVPDNLVGKKVRCSKCAGTFLAEAPSAPAPPAPARTSRRRDDDDDRSESEERPRRRRRRDYDEDGAPGRGGMLLSFGIISILLAVFS